MEGYDAKTVLPSSIPGRYWRVRAAGSVRRGIPRHPVYGRCTVQSVYRLPVERQFCDLLGRLFAGLPRNGSLRPNVLIRGGKIGGKFRVNTYFDVSGRRVRDLVSETRSAGSHSVKWDGKDSEGISVPSGIYICRMEPRSIEGRRFSRSVKMGLVR
jgi:hypothetical protein